MSRDHFLRRLNLERSIFLLRSRHPMGSCLCLPFLLFATASLSTMSHGSLGGTARERGPRRGRQVASAHSVRHSCFQPASAAAASRACKLRVLDQSRCTVAQLRGTEQLGELTPSAQPRCGILGLTQYSRRTSHLLPHSPEDPH